MPIFHLFSSALIRVHRRLINVFSGFDVAVPKEAAEPPISERPK
jgi:hypothetical protein